MNRVLVAACAMALLAGCASDRLSDPQRLALYHAHAGAPVKDFRYFNRLNGWVALGDSALAVWTRPNQGYLLEVDGGCTGLDYAPTILITQWGDRVSAGFDRVQVLDSPRGFNISCRITGIRPLDVKALRDSEKQLRQARLGAREAPAPP